MNHSVCRIPEEEVNHGSIHVSVQYYKNDSLVIYNLCRFLSLTCITLEILSYILVPWCLASCCVTYIYCITSNL